MTQLAGSQLQSERKSQPGGPVELPADLRRRLDGQLSGHEIIAWSEFDLDDANRYRQQFVILTDQAVVEVSDGWPATARKVQISEISKVEVVEGLGVDRLIVTSNGKVAMELRYSRRYRRDMTRLHRKLSRRIPRKDDNGDVAPDWLESVEREVEKQEHCAKCGELIPAYAEGACPRCLQKRAILWRLLEIARPYKWRVRTALMLTVLVPLLITIPPAMFRYLVDSLTQNRGTSELFRWSGWIALTYVVTEIVGGTRMYILARVGTQVTADLRHLIYAHLHELSMRFFAKRRTGSLITRVTSDTDRLWDFIAFGPANTLRDCSLVVFIAAAMFWINWRLAAVSLLPLPLLGLVTYQRGSKMQKKFGQLWTYWSRITAVVGDALPGIKVVKAFANEGREVKRFDIRSDEYTAREQEIHAIWTTLSPFISGLMKVGGLMVWLVGGYFVIRWPETRDASGRVTANPGNTVGVLVAFSTYLWQFYQPVMELANSSRMVTRALSSAQRVFEVLDTPPEVYSRTGAVRKEDFEGKVEFRNVSFSYEGAQPALRDVSVTVEAGQMIGLCGTSGAGKSTFVNLICRFYDVTDGQILIDGVDIRDYDVKWLRRQIGMVLQEPYLFHGTIKDNIRYGNADASEADVIRAARAANAHDFIVSFPDGYDTMVGERGQSLSGGERQRVSIARAILHNPRLLILDEATSSVDTETEKQIQQALDRLVAGRTTFAIAHRLTTLQSADRLVVLEKGKIVEQGTHGSLVHKDDGAYAKLYKTQLEMNAQVAIK